MCLERAWNSGVCVLRAKAITPWLSTLISFISSRWRSAPRSHSIDYYQIDSLTAWVNVMYSASVEDKATVVCFLLCYVIAAPFNRKT